ncbi:GNAT family N-acetyltransferase [Dyadobacter sp. CY327]|uniref:GNAT family N-acetyltransferase n=1 Tax=Dyadobacter sp. CY327 TaxID=2907301 RepID=UPI001F42356F|nr:GNAT family N-acetyltransferase [Dyadobacter sp. CY327]MCE7069205.1 GNAT family N-acetyltransferase [Dyadobacter sp. CY327]
MIRPATSDDAPKLAPLIILALGHIACLFAKSDDPNDAIPLMERFIANKGNQYSYENTLVYEDENGVIGSIVGYNGACLHELRAPVLKALRESDPDFSPGDETEAGEYYVDCVNVNPAHQGKGIGKKLLNAFCELAAAKHFNRVGLIVDKVNPDARKIYEKVGFQVAGEKDFLGHTYDHMVREV